MNAGMSNLLALAGATAVLVAIPGPNVALIVAQCLRQGLRHGLLTVGATTFGVAVQLLLVVAGLTTLLDAAASALVWLRWLGVAYLIWLGVTTWRQPATADTGQVTLPQTAWSAILQGFVLAVLNPKTLLFNAAFLPQFLAANGDPARELPLLAAVYLTVILIGDVGWALGASGARRWLQRVGQWRNRLVGGLLVSAGVGLAVARHDA